MRQVQKQGLRLIFAGSILLAGFALTAALSADATAQERVNRPEFGVGLERRIERADLDVLEGYQTARRALTEYLNRLDPGEDTGTDPLPPSVRSSWAALVRDAVQNRHSDEIDVLALGLIEDALDDGGAEQKSWAEGVRLRRSEAGRRSRRTFEDVSDSDLATAGDDSQLANIDLQNALQRQQQAMQMMSNIMKTMHDTAMAIIRNMR